MPRIVRIAFLLAILAAVSVPAGGAELLVSQDGSAGFRTITGAIDAAHYGDRIYVNPGVYEEHVYLKDGITLIGAGATVTRIRYGYGFEEVLTARNASSGKVEGFTIERESSILAGPVVVLDSASVAIVDCTVSGGNGAGIEVRDEVSNPTIERSTITGNGTNGIWAYDGARLRIIDSEISGNGGNGVLLSGSAMGEISGGEIADNAGSGAALGDDATIVIAGTELSRNRSWGIELNDRSSARLNDATIAENEEGGIRLGDRSELNAAEARIYGGNVGIAGYGSSSFSIGDSVIGRLNSAGISLAEEATGKIGETEIIGCAGEGIIVETEGACSIDHATITGNARDGLKIGGGTVFVSNTIIAYNGSSGIRYQPSSGKPGKIVTSHNDLFGNKSADYVGIPRRQSDISAPPDFADLAGGDLTLRPGSACIGAGEGGTTIGAHPDPDGGPGTIVELIPSYTDLFGLDWSAYIRFSTVPFSLKTLQLKATYADRRTSLSFAGSILGAWGMRVEGEGAVSIFTRPVPLGEAGFKASCGFSGILDPLESWGRIWGEGRLGGDLYTIAGSLTIGLPDGPSGRIDLSLGEGIQLSASAHFAGLASDSLSIGLDGEVPLSSGAIGLTGRLSLIPDRILELSLSQGGGTIDTSLDLIAYLDRSGNWRGRFGLHLPEEGVTADIEASFLRLGLISGSLSVGVGSPSGRGEVGLGITPDRGVRFSIRFEADLKQLFSPPPDIPPLPSFSVYPVEPEAGEAVRFDGSGSSDPDGRITEYWWDFGDGELGMGETVEHTYRSAGEYPVTLSVTDDDGVVASISDRLTVWKPNTAPAASFVWKPVSPGGTPLDRPLRTTDRVILDASGSYDPDGKIAEYDWDLDSDGEFEVSTAEPRITVAPFGPGSHPVTLRVIDADERSGAVMHAITAEAPTPPKAEFVFTPSSPSILDPIRFTDRSTDADGTVVAWEWDFGDGLTSREQDPIHRYSDEGEYRATLTVTDDDGQTATIEETLRVGRIPQVVPVSGVWALIIGISDYAEVKDLAFGRADAEAVCRWALDAGIPPDHIRLLTDREGPLPGNGAIISEPASLVNAREGLGWLRRMARQDDLVLIYFSGHGYQGLDDGSDESDGVDEFFVLRDTRADAIDDTALRDDEFGRFLDRIESDHVLILFDGCYSGGLGRSIAGGYRPMSPSPDIFTDLGLEGRIILSAAKEGEEAFESETLNHGAFTYFALEGLKGKADLNGDSRVTAWELYEYVSREVPEHVRQERGEVQTPQIVGEGDVRVVVAGLPTPLDAGLSFSPTIPFALGPVSFTDESVSDSIPISCEWEFGDGGTATGGNPVHTYAEPGTYTVLLTATDPAGRVATASARIAVSSPGRVISVDPERRRGVISLGERNGIRVGDIFYIISRSGSETERKIEIVELLDGEGAVFQPSGDEPLPEIGSPVRSASDPG